MQLNQVGTVVCVAGRKLSLMQSASDHLGRFLRQDRPSPSTGKTMSEGSDRRCRQDIARLSRWRVSGIMTIAYADPEEEDFCRLAIYQAWYEQDKYRRAQEAQVMEHLQSACADVNELTVAAKKRIGKIQQRPTRLPKRMFG
jgi:hypothetical protein